MRKPCRTSSGLRMEKVVEATVGLRVWDLGFRVQGVRFRVWGFGLIVLKVVWGSGLLWVAFCPAGC